ncbi:MAG: hypothetical protein QF911_03305 [Candidatus Thalassarchaeaceae archaeon]|nr:hypothetical protein [Candidatus Thalassarchaeaceae archaeon]
MEDAGERLGLPQITEIELMRRLLSEDLDADLEEPAVAAGIGEQMLHMGMRPMPRSMRSRIRDICSKLPAKNAILIGGGIGHLAAWLLDLWCGGLDGENSPRNARPETFRIVEPGSRFGVIIDRLIRRYGAESWAKVIAKPWDEVSAEAATEKIANVALPEAALQNSLLVPPDLVIIDLPDEERVTAALSAFDLVASGGVVLVQEPTVPTGDVGLPEDGQNPTPAQFKVSSFNDWIGLIKKVDDSHSLGFVELTGGTLVALLRKGSV